jgi:hypothetical protein
MRLSNLPFLLLVTYGCGGDGPSDPSSLQIAGQWTFTETYTDIPLQTTCNNQAAVTFTQTGSTFTGSAVQTGTCTDPTGTFPNSGTFQLSNGIINGTTVSWRDDGTPVCNYTGTLSGTPPNQASGTVRCNGVAGGITFDANGTWQMTR